ncbi:MAG: hypothetical protein JSR28_00550 [Proteobacteria bacterium]|nr:hypothetical protein [Pseudomonadota bacterium]MDE2411204.1 hypothetical protein [Sphingomonadales bacterium]
MTADRARLTRLHRLERIRAVARDQAARDVAEAEGTLAQLEALAMRTRSMAEDYRDATPGDGFALQLVRHFVGGLGGITAATGYEAQQARNLADRMQAALSIAERRRAAVEDRALAERRNQARRSQAQALGARRTIGTELE